ncbi:MAG TPA: endo-1,4-beta-xylanase, partial [Polyangiaceae bacterium]|nr:endo-1,4-beta-xylanase [Polyangiaceae bacterium]
NGYLGALELTNVSGAPAKEYELLADVGGTKIGKCLLADCDAVEGGYTFTSPRLLKLLPIRRGASYPILFMSRDPYAGITPYVISINGVRCDSVAPQVNLSANRTFFTANGTLHLTATASDNVAVRKVAFLRDGQEIGVDTDAPYEIDVPADSTQNGRHSYTAVAYDPSGNQGTSNGVRVLTGIGNKFFGTAPDNAADYTHLLTYFNQLTPGNAGKWGSVEATRNQMDWSKLDTAYNFAKQNGVRFKLHTLIWGQQQPDWLSSLTPQAQLAEIEEWMSLAAQRYPDVDMVDVVNEPLHAPPAYSAALGGAGATGWDWVVKSFELARKYFPKAELLMNDYNVEALEAWTTDYLKIINVLKERGLIDGIGLQAHFLERAELPVIAANLDRMAATGLPIYVSELDVNFANDARHAQRLRDLFTLFWQHPSVLGVTHWGHLQGSMWRTDAYLIRSDGTTRPGMDWINCFRVGNTNCTVPEYVPTRRSGDASGITLEAEDYDDARGILALGDVVAYTDNTDWQSYDKVVFDKNWDSLSVTYARGGQDPANISVHLGSLDTPPVATVNLEPTGGWGTNKTVSIPFAPISGEQNVFIRYNGGYGIANVDRFVFGAPANLGPNLIANGEFESSANGWFTWDGTLSSSTDYAVSGARSLKLGNRNGNGPAATSLAGLVVPGRKYEVALWTTVGGSSSANVNITQKITCNGQDTYNWLINPTAVQPGQWTRLTGTLAVPDCNVTDVMIYAEGPAGGIDMYLDHVSVRAQQVANIVTNGTFESGISGWSTYSGTASSSSARAHSGSKSLLIGGRTGNAPAITNLTSAVTKGTSYQASFWVSIGGAASANVNLTRKIVCDGQTSYSWIANPVAVADGQWVELKGTLDIPNCTNLSEVLVFAEGPGAGVDLYVDDVNISVPSVTNLLSEGSFESSASGWFTWGTGTLGLTQTRAHGGSKSLLLAGRTGNSPMARSLMGLIAPGSRYQVSMWASIAGAATANVNVTRKFTCDGTDSYSWIINPVAVTDSGWVKLSGTLDVPNCALTDAIIYAEGPEAGVDLYLDDVVVSP